MTASPARALAQSVGDRLSGRDPWEVFAQRLRRYEIHFNGPRVEFVRGPLVVEGYGLRLFRSHGETLGVGFQASTDGSADGVRETVEEAEGVAAHASFPARAARLSGASSAPSEVAGVDPDLWKDPLRHLAAYVQALLAPFERTPGVVPSFGSVRGTLAETAITNSLGLDVEFPGTSVEVEIALKAGGGPEGPPPGEYWVNETVRRIDPAHAGDRVPEWARYAEDARRASAPPTGELPVVLPADVSAGILPSVVGFRWTGAARLRKVEIPEGATVAASGVSVYDDGRLPWGLRSAPYDDEGWPRGRLPLVEAGVSKGLMYDGLYAGAFDTPPTAAATRSSMFRETPWLAFTSSAGPGLSTLVVAPGDGGTDAELVEAAGDGIWVQQLGWAVPDQISGAFGGEIRIGYRIRGGKLAEPVRGGTVGGTVVDAPGSPSMLMSIAGVGSKPTLAETLHSPTLLVKNLTVAGA